MPIPPFDRHGNLPVGNLFASGSHYSLIHASLQEIHDRFVERPPDSGQRARIWQGWMRHRIAMEGIGIRYVTLVDGSFVTSKQEPGDVDLCILLDADEVNQVAEPQRADLLQLLSGPACKPGFSCDVYGVVVHPFNDPRFPLTFERFTYWTRVFGTDRGDRQKSFLLVAERGVL